MNISPGGEDENIRHLDGEHILVRLTYISRYNEDNGPGELERILEQAKENNALRGITGVLVFNHNFFLQSIEGSRPVINDLLRKLVRDPRHHSLQVIDSRETDQRRWVGWSMNYLTPTTTHRNEALRFSGGPTFNPYLMSMRQLMLLIETLTKMQEKQRKAEKQEETRSGWFGRRRAAG